ncbi:unnamed protein product [Owenia fusiformis]|uniref:DNA topoisomerase (ATP-hydrolyzing) n=1 Tax=Owenia fusiformis TaxID=6347 RepID=A0A8J1UCD9_OWEFU|nr:unnamed protein product [Owenia fusiformis]
MSTDHMWSFVDELRRKLEDDDRINKLVATPTTLINDEAVILTESATRDNTLGKIESKILEICRGLSNGEPPSLTYDSRSTWDNIMFEDHTGIEMISGSNCTTVKFDAIASVNKLATTLKVLSIIYRLVQSDTFSTKRDIFYQNVGAFGRQSVVDEVVNNISCMLKVPRWQLHVLATSKGCIAGNLRFTEEDGSSTNCSLSSVGVMVPMHVQGLKDMYTDARFVLVVEKDATFQKLMEEDICNKLGPCIVITGKGFPDMNTRLMVRKIWEIFHLPSFALVDADPHGMEIMCNYKFGSKSLSFEAPSLTVPTMRWVGVLPSDIQQLHIPEESLISLSTLDIRKAQELLSRPFFSSQLQWKKELQLMLDSGYKGEIQCLTSLSPNYLTEVYLPNKLRYGEWL